MAHFKATLGEATIFVDIPFEFSESFHHILTEPLVQA